jgi:hypothetical protein
MLLYTQCSPVSSVLTSSSRIGLYRNYQPSALLSLFSYHQLLFIIIIADLSVTQSLTQSALYRVDAQLLFEPLYSYAIPQTL